MQVTDPRHVAALTALAEAGIPVDVQELLLQTGALANALDAAAKTNHIARLERYMGVAGGGFALGDRTAKIKGSSWNGRVVGFYSTRLTPVGYVIESEREPGSCQLYPEAALAPASDAKGSAE